MCMLFSSDKTKAGSKGGAADFKTPLRRTLVGYTLSSMEGGYQGGKDTLLFAY